MTFASWAALQQDFRLILIGGVLSIAVYQLYLARTRPQDPGHRLGAMWTMMALVCLTARVVMRAEVSPEVFQFAYRVSAGAMVAMAAVPPLVWVPASDGERRLRAVLLGAVALLVTTPAWGEWLVTSQVHAVPDAFGAPLRRLPMGPGVPWVAIVGLSVTAVAVSKLRAQTRADLRERRLVVRLCIAVVLGAVLHDRLLFAGVIVSVELFDVSMAAVVTALHVLMVRRAALKYVDLEHQVADRDLELEHQRAQLAFADRMQALANLSSGLAHELNNPLTAVQEGIDHSLERLFARGVEDAETLSGLEEARAGVLIASDIVARMQMYSSVTGSDGGVIDVPAAVDTAVKMLQLDPASAIRVVTAVGPVPGLEGDPGEFTQVCVGLLTNAVEGIRRGSGEGTVRVSATSNSDGQVVVRVQDDGVGIPDEDLVRVFEPRFSTKPFVESTGLGLSMCQAIITAMGGSISLDSVPGSGATVTCVLPAAQTASPSLLPSMPVLRPAPVHEALRLLVVDDDPLVGRALLRTLREHRVDVVDSAEEALRHLEGRSFDVILCDVMMPGMSGLDLYDALSARSESLAARVVFVTGGATSPETRARLSSFGPNRVLTKPVDRTLLRRALQKTIARAGLSTDPSRDWDAPAQAGE